MVIVGADSGSPNRTPKNGVRKEVGELMHELGRLFALQIFRFRWFTYTGVAFQDLFADLMESARPGDFQKVIPYGPRGDLKCDGYWRSRKCVFQCYGPSSMKEYKVIAKIREDLTGAVTHWDAKIQNWIFVHNSMKGLTANVVQVLEELRDGFPQIEIEEWAWPRAREQFNILSDDAIVDLFGYPPKDHSVSRLSFDELRPVVENIEKGIAEPIIALDDPPSLAKLEKNSLDQASKEFLQLGRLRVRLVENYFDQHHDPVLGDRIATAMQKQYRMLVDLGLHPDEVLVQLQQFAGWGAGHSSSHDVAVLTVLSYFFDRCDIFEDPNDTHLGA